MSRSSSGAKGTTPGPKAQSSLVCPPTQDWQRQSMSIWVYSVSSTQPATTRCRNHTCRSRTRAEPTGRVSLVSLSPPIPICKPPCQASPSSLAPKTYINLSPPLCTSWPCKYPRPPFQPADLTQSPFHPGVHLPNLLTTNTADIAAVSSNGYTFLFHYTNASSPTAGGGSVTGIHQFTISGSPATANEAFNLSQSLVAAPAYPPGTNASLYQPLAASISSVQGMSEELLVMWADAPVGDPSSNSTGYGQLSQLTRPVGNATWDAQGKVGVPLGNKNSQDSGS